jgi:shikimate kinase
MTPSSPTLPERRRPVLLVGMMGAGKSSVGRLVAARLGWPHADSDEAVQRRTGRTVPQLFAEVGEVGFRAEETLALEDALATSAPIVLSVAGGAVLSAANRRLLRDSGLVIWLRAELATLALRVGRGQGRPLLGDDPLAGLTRLYAERRPLYQEVAEITVDVDHLSLREVADRVIAAAGDPQHIPHSREAAGA